MKQRVDRVLLAAAVLQTTAGLAILGSASWLVASERYGLPGSYFLAWQASSAFIGLGAMVVALHLRPSVLAERRLLLTALGGCWLLLVAAFFGPKVANTHRWLSLGGLSIQPSVLARVVLVCVVAALLDLARREGWPRHRLLEVLAAVAVTAGLVVAEPDLGSAALIVLVAGAMAFVAGVELRLFALPAAISLVLLVVAIAVSPYRLARVQAFFSPDATAAADWQTRQSLGALGSGGLTGTGYGAGLQKLFFLPEPHTDFIFAITGEELGLLGALTILGLAAVITWRGLAISWRLRQQHLALLAFGLTFAFAAQALIHVAVCLDLLPPKGIPLPLVSYGKTDLVVSLGAIGLLLNLSREVGQ